MHCKCSRSVLSLLIGLCGSFGCGTEHAPATTSTTHDAGAPATAQALAGHVRGDSRTAARNELAQRLGPLLQRDARRVTVETRADGRTHVDLHGGFGHALVARRGPDGHLRIDCLDNLPQAERYFDLAAASATVEAAP